MTGRHAATRPPRHTSRGAVVVFGVATATIPLSLPTAEASPSVNWDRVAQCESTGNWSINSGNGFSGGLQFTPSTWRAFGGTQYAPAAWQASRTEQIAIAENVLRGQGIGAWPVCGPKGVGGTTRNPGTPSASPRTNTPQPTPQRRTPAVPDQPRAVQQAVAASGPTNPACRSLKSRGIPVGQLDRLNAAHPELHLDGNRNGVPCEVTYPRHSSNSRSANTSSPTARNSATATSTERVTDTADTTVTTSGLRARVIASARGWLGVPYRFGGASRSGVDCSGLTQAVLRANGISVPRTADAQMRATTRITRAQAQPGDLVFFTDSNGRAYHEGIYLGGNQMINAAHSGTVVRVQSIWSANARFTRLGS